MTKAGSVLALLLVGLGLIAASVGLGFWFAAVQTACEKPYRDDWGKSSAGCKPANSEGRTLAWFSPGLCS
jgi:hypothetical protein